MLFVGNFYKTFVVVVVVAAFTGVVEEPTAVVDPIPVPKTLEEGPGI